MLEYTDDASKSYVAPAIAGSRGEVRPDRLLNLPTLMMSETGVDEPQFARVGHISGFVRSGRKYTFTFMPNPSMAPIPTARIEAASRSLGITDWEFQRTHWAVKDVDLYRALDEHVTGTRPAPKVFSFPTEQPVESDLVAVMMPFGREFQPVYDSLKSGIESIGMRALRADDIWERDHIMDDVISLIWRARVVVTDLSGKNPNVFYEAGIAHTLGRDVIPVAQSIEDVPFDLRSIRTSTYLNNGEGRRSLASNVAKRLRTVTGSLPT